MFDCGRRSAMSVGFDVVYPLSGCLVMDVKK